MNGEGSKGFLTRVVAEYSVMQSFIRWKVVSFVEVKMVTKEPNLKEIERRAYVSYHEDGLLDIFVGVYVVGFGLGVLVDRLWDLGFGSIMPAILIATILPIWIAAKRKITVPRIGFVKFGPQGMNKLMAIFIGLTVAGLGVFFALALFQSGRPAWIDLLFQNGLLVVGFGSLAVCIVFGYSMGLKRLYAYGLLALVALVIGHFAGIFFAYIIMALGTVVLATGIALLIGFVRKYRVKGDKAIVE